MLRGVTGLLLSAFVLIDAGSNEAGKKFLEENKGKDGVITLPSGLQYKVLRKGDGERGTVSLFYSRNFLPASLLPAFMERASIQKRRFRGTRLRARAGLYHPTVSSPCECHYQGTLIDGTKFDSSYDRGSPTSFAPNQVIKGWTEAMQLMVEGDKWEMCALRFRRNSAETFSGHPHH
jgi:FKBP-type peptidyl-prolyl cis-trans isomerase FklB